MSELNRETRQLQTTGNEAPRPLQFTLRGLLWTVFVIAFLAGSAVTARAEQPAVWFLFVFGGSLVAQSVFLHVESRGRSLRWFALGALSVIIASIYAAWVRGNLAFVQLAVGGLNINNELAPTIDTLPGCLAIVAGLAIFCGIIVAVIHSFVSNRIGLAIISCILLATWLLLWHVGVAAHEIPWSR